VSWVCKLCGRIVYISVLVENLTRKKEKKYLKFMLAGGSKGLFSLCLLEWRLVTLGTRRYIILFVSSIMKFELRSWRKREPSAIL
jgi:hypothetical protein